MPIIETGVTASEGTRHSLKEEIPEEYESYVSLLNSQDDFLQTKTLYLLAFIADDRYIPHMAALLNSPSRVVRDMARFAIQKSGRFAIRSPKARPHPGPAV